MLFHKAQENAYIYNYERTDVPVATSEVLDSDDEAEAYIEKVKCETKAQLESADEAELDRRLTTLGYSTKTDQLMNTLTAEEKLAFTSLYEDISEAGPRWDCSVFKKKKAD